MTATRKLLEEQDIPPYGNFFYGCEYVWALRAANIPNEIHIFHCGTGEMLQPGEPWMRWIDLRTGASGWHDKSLCQYLGIGPIKKPLTAFRNIFEEYEREDAARRREAERVKTRARSREPIAV